MRTPMPHRVRLATGASLCLLLLASPVAAQRNGFVAGVKFGVGMAHFHGEDSERARARLLVGGGAFLNYPLTPKVSLQPEILVSSKGGELESEGPSEVGSAGAYRSRYTLGYVEIPLLLKVMPWAEWPVRPNVFAGPALAVKVFGDVGAESTEERLKRLDWGAAAGAGVDFKLNTRRVMLDARYTFGLTNILELAGPPQVRNGAFLVSVGIVL